MQADTRELAEILPAVRRIGRLEARTAGETGDIAGLGAMFIRIDARLAVVGKPPLQETSSEIAEAEGRITAYVGWLARHSFIRLGAATTRMQSRAVTALPASGRGGEVSGIIGQFTRPLSARLAARPRGLEMRPLPGALRAIAVA